MEWDTSKKNTAKKFNIYTLIPLTDYVWKKSTEYHYIYSLCHWGFQDQPLCLHGLMKPVEK
jgi:hypothetical protein